MNFRVLQVIAIVDLPDSNGENAVEKLEKEFGADHAIFLAGNVASVQGLTGTVLADTDYNSKTCVVKY